MDRTDGHKIVEVPKMERPASPLGFRADEARIIAERKEIRLEGILMHIKQECKCEDIAMGSYKRQIWVHAPSHMPKENGYCLDLCIAQEVMQLWMKGITTTGCCCGHNLVEGYISVNPTDIKRMHELGYKEYRHPDGLKDHFIPKYDRLL